MQEKDIDWNQHWKNECSKYAVRIYSVTMCYGENSLHIEYLLVSFSAFWFCLKQLKLNITCNWVQVAMLHFVLVNVWYFISRRHWIEAASQRKQFSRNETMRNVKDWIYHLCYEYKIGSVVYWLLQFVKRIRKISFSS